MRLARPGDPINLRSPNCQRIAPLRYCDQSNAKPLGHLLEGPRKDAPDFTDATRSRGVRAALGPSAGSVLGMPNSKLICPVWGYSVPRGICGSFWERSLSAASASVLSSLVLISATSSISASPTASSLWAFACCFWELSCILSALARCALAKSEQSSALSIIASSDFLIEDSVILGTVQTRMEV